MSCIVVKIGGALLESGEAMTGLWDGIRRVRRDRPVVLLHGGGPQATEIAGRLGHVPRIVHGRRVTTDMDLEIIQWTLRGALNVRLVALALAGGIPAVGISGADDAMVRVHRRPPRTIDGEVIDFGWVGDIDSVDTALVELLLRAGRLPVVAPLGIDETGLLYNVNADTVAAALAGALGAARLLMVTESGGVRTDPADPGSLLSHCTRAQFESGVAEGWIRDGMRVKLSVAFDAIDRGVREVGILSVEDLRSGSGGTRVTP